MQEQARQGRKIDMDIVCLPESDATLGSTVMVLFGERVTFSGSVSASTDRLYLVCFEVGDTPKIEYIQNVSIFKSDLMQGDEQDMTVVQYSSIREAAENANEDFGLIEFIRNDLASAFPTILDGYTDSDEIGSYGDCQYPETVPAMAVN